MTKVFFYCDESGAKGYADQDESYPGEIGVFAGIMIPEERIDAVRRVFNEIAKTYTPTSGKLHIAELATEKQQAMRDDIFAKIKQEPLPCFWYSIHVAGLRENHLREKKLLGEFAKDSKNKSQRFKRGSYREEFASMHVELFSGLYSHLIAFLVERGKSNVNIEIKTDQVDTPVMKNFVEVAKDLLNTDPHVLSTTGFDVIDKKVVTGSIISSIQWPPELDFSPVVQSLSIETVPPSDGLVLAVDVLANSLNYLFKNRSINDLYKPLNCRDAIQNHPIKENLDAFEDWGTGDLIGDLLYKHPKAV